MEKEKEKEDEEARALDILASAAKYLINFEVMVVCGDESNQQVLDFLDHSRKMFGLQVSEAMIPPKLSSGVEEQNYCLADPKKKIFLIGRRRDMFFRINEKTVLIVGSKDQPNVRKFLRQYDLSAAYCVPAHFVDFSQNHSKSQYHGDLWVVKTHG